jgi:hypothetical protein
MSFKPVLLFLFWACPELNDDEKKKFMAEVCPEQKEQDWLERHAALVKAGTCLCTTCTFGCLTPCVYDPSKKSVDCYCTACAIPFAPCCSFGGKSEKRKEIGARF